MELSPKRMEARPKRNPAKGLLRGPEWGEVPAPMSIADLPRPDPPYVRLLDMVRQKPGAWAKIAVFDEGNQRATYEAQTRLCTKINRWLADYVPLEVWEIRRRRLPDTWSTREIWIRYVGDVTAEEAQQLRELRRHPFGRKNSTPAQRRADAQARERIINLAVAKDERELAAYMRERERRR